MQQPQITAQDKKDLEKFAKFLCLKSSQVIVQGRLGKPITSQCSPLPTGAEWFNLAIKDYPEIQKEAKSALMDGNPNIDSSFIVEISLRTSDSESLALEVWSLSVTAKYEDVRVHHTVYNRMSLLLKSLMCVSRATPAYKLSRTQGSEYVICFRVYKGKVDISGLGEGFKTLRVGSIGTPTGTFILSAAFRTAENLHVSTKKLAPGTGGPIQVSPDHFYSPQNPTMSPARPCCTLKSRLMSRGELDSGSQSPRVPADSSSYGVLPTSFTTSPSDLVYIEAARNRSNSEQSSVFTVGTPPHLMSQTRLSSSSQSPHLAAAHRRFSEVNRMAPSLTEDEPKRNRHTHSHSEQNISHLEQYENVTTTNKDRNIHPNKRSHQQGIIYSQSGKMTRDPRSVDSSNKASLTSTLTSEKNSFKPITDNLSDERTYQMSKSRDKIERGRVSSGHVVRSFDRKKEIINMDSVTTLKSSSPTNARVGFPDNNETTSHLTYVPPSPGVLSPTQRNFPRKVLQPQLIMPSPGAFVSNSKTAARAYSTLSGISDAQKLPFQELIAEKEDNKSRKKKTTGCDSSSSDTSPESGREGGSTITRLSSQSSLSSHHSSEVSPTHGNQFPALPELEDEFVMVDLNPAFGKSDSAGDLGTFFRECENAPDLVMFQENNGTETQEALLDLTKQLEDYERDAEDFDHFVEELQSTLP